MKYRLIIMGLFCLIAFGMAAQVAIPKNQLKLNPQLLQKNIKFKVVNQVSDTTSRIDNVEAFHLKPGEKKAVAITGQQMTALDKANVRNIGELGPQAKIYTLPELYYARVAGTNEQIAYNILFIDSAPLKYDLSRDLFQGSIRFLPVEAGSGGNPVQKHLSSPEDIIISYGSEKIPLNISNVNWPPLDVDVDEANPMDSVRVKVLTVNNPSGYLKYLRVEPAILISSTRRTIQGLGIQTLPVHVALKGVSRSEPVPVTIETSLGTLDGANMTLTGDQPQEAVLRSEGIGDIRLRAINPNFVSNSISVKAVFPWLFLILALAGGLIGALGKDLFGNEKIRGRHLAYGSIAGLIAAVAYWGLGIVLIGFHTDIRGINEAMVFGFGLLAGYFGLKIPGAAGQSSET